MKVLDVALTCICILGSPAVQQVNSIFVREFDMSIFDIKDEDVTVIQEYSESDDSSKHRARGKASVSPTVLKSLLEHTGHVLPVSGMEGAILPTTQVAKTSPYHRDYFSTKQVNEYGETYQQYRAVGDQLVAFLSTNTNEDAYFDHGGTSIPIVEGSLVVFEGGTRHRTVVNSGVVNMLGPFDLRGKRKVSGKGGFGDPHIVRWDGHRFDFHGECDLVMFKSPGFRSGHGLHVHLRTTMVDNWSYIETVGIQVGKDTLEMSARGKYFINGEPEAKVELETDGKTFEYDIGGYIATYSPPMSEGNPTNFYVMKIGLGDGVNIAIKSFRHKKFMAIETTGFNYDMFHDGLGLAGAFGLGIMVGRDGIKVFDENDTDNFGQDWQVRDPDDPIIFQTARAPQFPTQCIMPDSNKAEGVLYDEDGDEIPGATATNGDTGVTAKQLRRKKRRNRRRRLGQMVSEDEAETACAYWKKEDIDSCIMDVLATGDVELAEAGRFI